MSDHVYTGQTKTPSNPYQGEPSIMTFAGLKKEANTAVIQYFAPIVALYNIVASTAGFPTVQWRVSGQGKTG
jgi:hypothetical protein